MTGDPQTMRYAELQTTSNFGFLRGASHPEELVVQAEALGLAGLALTDRNSLAGVVRAHAQARASRPPLPGRLPARSGGRHLAPVLAHRQAGLCPAQLAAHPRQAAGGQGRLHADAGGRAGPRCRAVVGTAAARDAGCGLRRRWPSGCGSAGGATSISPSPTAMPATMPGGSRAWPGSRLLAGIEPLATNDVYYHHPDRRPLQDVLTCIREHCGSTRRPRLFAHAERHLKPPHEMARLFRDHPQASRARWPSSSAAGSR